MVNIKPKDKINSNIILSDYVKMHTTIYDKFKEKVVHTTQSDATPGYSYIYSELKNKTGMYHFGTDKLIKEFSGEPNVVEMEKFYKEQFKIFHYGKEQNFSEIFGDNLIGTSATPSDLHKMISHKISVEDIIKAIDKIDNINEYNKLLDALNKKKIKLTIDTV